jgi:hypothetical protein
VIAERHEPVHESTVLTVDGVMVDPTVDG